MKVLSKDDCNFLGNIRVKSEIILWGRKRGLLHYEEVSKVRYTYNSCTAAFRYTSSCGKVLTSYDRFVAHYVRRPVKTGSLHTRNFAR